MSKAPMAALALVWFLGVLAFGGGVVGDRQLPSIVRQAIFVVDWSEPAISNVVTIKNVFPKEIYSTYKYQIAPGMFCTMSSTSSVLIENRTVSIAPALITAGVS